MSDISLGLFVCFAIPLLMAILFLKGRGRQAIFFIFLGMLICLFCGELNGLILNNSNLNDETYSIFVASVIEEIFKTIPLLLFVFGLKPNKKNIVESALLLGIGFSTHENAYVLTYYGDSISVTIAIFRALGAGMMHVVTTLYIGYVISIIKDKKLVGLYVLITLLIAITYHGLFNFVVSTNYPYIAFFIPFVTFIPLVIYLNHIKCLPKHRKEETYE